VLRKQMVHMRNKLVGPFLSFSSGEYPAREPLFALSDSSPLNQL
jgi:hypothetical protein